MKSQNIKNWYKKKDRPCGTQFFKLSKTGGIPKQKDLKGSLCYTVKN